jgi:hypothetical protein
LQASYAGFTGQSVQPSLINPLGYNIPSQLGVPSSQSASSSQFTGTNPLSGFTGSSSQLSSQASGANPMGGFVGYTGQGSQVASTASQLSGLQQPAYGYGYGAASMLPYAGYGFQPQLAGAYVF